MDNVVETSAQGDVMAECGRMISPFLTIMFCAGATIAGGQRNTIGDAGTAVRCR